MVLHLLMQLTSPVRLRKRYLPAALSTTRTVVHRLKASSFTKMFYLKSGKLVCRDTILTQASSGVLENRGRCGGMNGATHQMALCQAPQFQSIPTRCYKQWQHYRSRTT